MTDLAAQWAKQFQPRPDARARVFFFPHAGAGASAVQRWGSALPGHIEFRPIEYPGRWTRWNEPLPTSVESVADAVADALPALLDRPYVVIGYSLGALIAFEWLRRVAQRGVRGPTGFIVCSMLAPHLPRRLAPIHGLGEHELLAELQRRFGDVGLLDDPERRALVLPVLRADLRVRETYMCRPGTRLSCPMLAIRGASDETVTQGELDAWREHSTGPFSAHVLSGGHFLIADSCNAESLRLRVTDLLGGEAARRFD